MGVGKGTAVLGGHVQRSPLLLVPGHIHRRATVQQQLDHLHIPVLGGVVQGCQLNSWIIYELMDSVLLQV